MAEGRMGVREVRPLNGKARQPSQLFCLWLVPRRSWMLDDAGFQAQARGSLTSTVTPGRPPVSSKLHSG